MRENIMRFGRGAGTWAGKTHPALSPINDCGTKVGYVDFLAQETINTTSEKELTLYPWWQEAEWVGTRRLTMNGNPKGVIPPNFFLLVNYND